MYEKYDIKRMIREEVIKIAEEEKIKERDANICWCHGVCRCDANKPHERNFKANNICYCYGQCRCGYHQGVVRAKIADGSY